MPSGFEVKKQRILEQLTIASEQYNDRSPKGSIDEGIRGLVDEINDVPGLVTTSSCAGRVSVFLEGKKKIASDEHPFPSALTRENDSEPLAIGGPGGKGGGKWLFVSHTPLATSSDDVNSTPFQDLFGLKSREYFSSSISHGVRLVHFKFEAMILHLLTASLQDAQTVLSAASSAGFRESGAMSLNQGDEHTPMVAVRSTGLAFDTIIGYQDDEDNIVSIVTEAHLRLMVDVSIDRFKANSERIQRFRSALLSSYQSTTGLSGNGLAVNPTWEDTAARKARKREEGLARQRDLLQQAQAKDSELDNPDQS